MNNMVAYGSHNIHGGTPSHISQRHMRIHSFVLPIHEVGSAMLYFKATTIKQIKNIDNLSIKF